MKVTFLVNSILFLNWLFSLYYVDATWEMTEEKEVNDNVMDKWGSCG